MSHTSFYQDESERPDLEPNKILAGKFKLLEQLGRGGMGVVWKAQDHIADRLVALKFVPKDLNRFEDEMKRVRSSFGKVHSLNHQSICPLYSLENDLNFGYYLVMKYLDGETLDNFKSRKDPNCKGLPLEPVIEWLTPVAEALDYAHKNDVIHRDIKPSNVFLVFDEAENIRDVQVIDFGLADEIKSSMNRVSQVQIDISGTRPYMAPEQWRGWRQTEATDQYALAVVAYELLSGYLPFEGGDTQVLSNAVLNFPPQSIRRLADHTNAALLKALAKDGSDRFDSCTEFIAALGGTEIRPQRVDNKSRNGAQHNDGQPQPAAPGVESLMKRGHLFLEDSDWKQANDYFDRVLDINPEYAPAYTGKLCAELKVPSEESLGDYEKPIADFGNFKKALRFAHFAHDGYKATLEGYDEKIRERLRQEQYDGLAQRKNQATEQQCLPLAEEFRAMNGYKDTVALAEECEKQYHVLKEQREEQERQAQYDRLVTAKNRASEKDFPDLAEKFQAMNGYKDTAELATECDAQYRLLKERREEQERLAREEAERREQQRLQAEYKRLGELTKTAKTEEDWRKLAVAFRQMKGFRNTAELASQCADRARKRREAEERERKAGTRVVLPVKGVEFPFRWCPAGTFTMGSPISEKDRYDNETRHQVTLSRGFWLLETPVTQGMWEGIMGNNPSHFKGGQKLPVESVSREDCQGFIQKLNGLNIAPAGYRFSLPTEAQWEYACRAGTTTPFHFGSVLNGDKANCDGNNPYGTSTKGQYLQETSEVGSYSANAWGLFDMHGNVWEWCADWYGNYPGSVTDPVGASSGSRRVLRGGSWRHFARGCRSANRRYVVPSHRDNGCGVRISLVRAE